ncbi:MAG: hypothetical protein Q8L85_06020 [Alphaproteobacteria bacterium]|nr:hypothetical protein [Alphaproteobacteria bacterium]
MFKINLLFYALFGSFILTNSSVLVARDAGDESNKEEKILLSFETVDKKKEKRHNKRSRYDIVPNPLDMNSFFIVDRLESKRKRVKTSNVQMEVVDPWLSDQRFIGAKDKSGNMVTTTRSNHSVAADLGLFDPAELHAINTEIAELRYNLYRQFHQNYVQQAGGKFKFNGAEGIYTKFKDMRSEEELHDGFYEGMNLTQAGFYEKMNIGRDDLIQLMEKSGQLLLQVQPHLNMSAFAKALYTRRTKEFQEVANLYVGDGNDEISFNGFLEQLDRTDAFLENARQVFQSILSLETLEVIKQKPVVNADGSNKFVPIAMKTGLDR